MTLKAMDGSSAQLMDTPANQEAYPQPSGQLANERHATQPPERTARRHG